MIDIHTHVIYGVDDGAKTLEESIAIIKEEIKQGVTDIICTPHYRKRMFEARSEKVLRHFEEVRAYVLNNKLPVNLYLGREIHYSHSIIEFISHGHLGGLNGSNDILMEFSYTEDENIPEVAYNLKLKGFRMVVAHIERYQYIKDLDPLYELKDLGALIQINASTICGANGLREKKKVMTYIKEGLVDFVASDIHYKRRNFIEKAYKIVEKKFGIEVADSLFNNNAKIFIERN